MTRLLKNESGSIMVMAVAVVMTIVSVVSAWSMVGMVSNSEIQTQYDHDTIQEELLLRSESIRSHLAIEHNNTTLPPPRTVFIQDVKGKRQTVYEIKNKTEQRFVTIFLGQATEQAIAVMSLISAKRGRPRSIRYTSPIQRFSERLIRNESLAQYQYFTNYETSENSEGTIDRVKFWGPDVLNGPVHSNDDIWIQNGGGGNNGGWPTFYSLVTTAGRARQYPGGDPVKNLSYWEEIFRGGLQEEVDNIQEIVFEPNADELRQNGHPIGEGHDIVYAKINGSSCDLYYGDIVEVGTQDFEVYSWFPSTSEEVNTVVGIDGNWYEDADNIWTNTITIYDTVWTSGGSVGSGNFSAYWVEDAELWIEGDVSGKMTWGCADTIFIVDDITYVNTDHLGQYPYPDGFSGYSNTVPPEPLYEGPVNETDFFGLVSEQKILVRYKHRDPFLDNILRDGNCNDVYLYGAYAALAEGNEAIHGVEACHYDGIFTFQYHHWHGSTPSFWAQSPYAPHAETLYTYVDLHKYIFPINDLVPNNIQGFNLHGNNPPPGWISCGFPYEDPIYINSFPNNNSSNYAIPYGTDYPWYNPVWPEPQVVDLMAERGILHIYGAIAQRRRGFIHRSGTDPFNHPNNEWDIPDYHYDGIHGTSTIGTGYDKDYSYDTRLLVIQPPYYPQVYEGWGEATVSSFSKEAWTYKSPRDW